VSTSLNWSPVFDATTLRGSPSPYQWSSGQANGSEPHKKAPAAQYLQPDKVYTASSRGIHGNVTEWRKGVQARIGLDIDIEEPIREVWAFSAQDCVGIKGLLVLLGLPDSTMALQFSEDLSQVDPLTAADTRLDLESRTLFAAVLRMQFMIQITEASITVTRSDERCVTTLNSL
jgi:hypothetical protein